MVESRVAVLGSGVQGLVAALRLAQEGARVDVYERWPWPGGRAAAFDLGDGLLAERLPLPFAPGDTHALALCDELGLHDVTWERATTTLLADGRAVPAWRGVKALGRGDRRRLEQAGEALGRGELAASGEAQAWTVAELGAPAWTLLAPVLRHRHGTDAGLPARHVAALLAPGLAGHLAGTSAALVAALQAAVAELGGRVLLDRPVARMRPAGAAGGLLLTAGAPGSWRRGRDPREYDPDGSPERYDAVVAGVAGEVLVDLCDDPLAALLGEPLLARLEQPPARTVVVLVLELDHEVTRTWRTLVADPGLPFAELRERTAAGRHVLHVLAERDAADALTALDADHVLTAFIGGLRAVEPGFGGQWVLDARVHRDPVPDPAAAPVGLRTPVPGLVVAHGDLHGAGWSVEAMARLGTAAAAAVSVPR